MHDLDRTLNEFESEAEAFDMDEFEFDDGEELEFEFDSDDEQELDADEEMELASELLSVESDEEMEQFLGKVFKKASRLVRRVARSPVVRRLRRHLKPMLKRFASKLGGGGGFGGGGDILGMARQYLGFELEGMAPEDAEMEIAKKLVRFAANAAKKAAAAPASAPAATVAKKAVLSAARKHVPGLVGRNSQSIIAGSGRSGRWIRRGRKIILLGV